MERMTIAKTETTTLREMGQPMTERNLRRGRRYQLQALKADTTGFMVASETIGSNSIWDVNVEASMRSRRLCGGTPGRGCQV